MKHKTISHLKIVTDKTNTSYFQAMKHLDFAMLTIFPVLGKISSDHALSDANVQKLINRNDLHFDLIINEEIFHDSFLMFGHKFKAPIVTICNLTIIYCVEQKTIQILNRFLFRSIW